MPHSLPACSALSFPGTSAGQTRPQMKIPYAVMLAAAIYNHFHHM